MKEWPKYPYTENQLRDHASFLAAERDRLLDKIGRFESCLVWLARKGSETCVLVEAARKKYNL